MTTGQYDRDKCRADPDIASRLGHVEGEVESLTQDVTRLGRSVDNLCNGLAEWKDAVNNRFSGYGKTNWSVVLAAVVVVMAIYAAAIRPLERDTERQAVLQVELAKAVVVQNEKHDDLKNDVVKLGVEAMVLAKEVNKIETFGSAPVDKRLTVLEELYKASEQRASEQRASEQRASGRQVGG